MEVLGALVVLIFLLPFLWFCDFIKREQKRVEDERLRKQFLERLKYETARVNQLLSSLIGKKINNRYESFKKICEILMPIHQGLKIEALAIIILDQENAITKTDVKFGNNFSVSCTPQEVLEIAIKNNGSRLVLGHNHPGEHSVPSDNDIIHGVTLYLQAKENGIEIVDNLVVCRDGLKSILDTHRFKQMIRIYRCETAND